MFNAEIQKYMCVCVRAYYIIIKRLSNKNDKVIYFIH